MSLSFSFDEVLYQSNRDLQPRHLVTFLTKLRWAYMLLNPFSGFPLCIVFDRRLQIVSSYDGNMWLQNVPIYTPWMDLCSVCPVTWWPLPSGSCQSKEALTTWLRWACLLHTLLYTYMGVVEQRVGFSVIHESSFLTINLVRWEKCTIYKSLLLKFVSIYLYILSNLLTILDIFPA